MGFYKPSELISFLKEHNIHPKKGLSQNFLIDGNIVRKIVQAADVHEDDLILEIGPGLGVLTHELLKKGKVVAVEKDRFFAEQLSLLKDKNLLQVLMNTDLHDFL
ncbi:MAG: hypothetical protein HZB76_00655 [Chlamydiae bacterium]|nr:hypothetical protein [Chlamydiota bacterium]